MTQPNPFRIRPLTPADIDPALALAAGLPTAPQWPRTAYQAAFDPAATPRRVALALDCDGRLAAFAVASIIPPDAELETICVAPAFQRQGLAGQLLAAMAAELCQAGATTLNLEVRASNAPALALYDALNFQQTARRTRYYANPEEDALLLTLPLTPEPPQSLVPCPSSLSL